jgi:hypothetical protein
MPVTEGKISVTEGSGKDLDTAIVTTGLGNVHREGNFVADPETAAARQKVTNADPGGTDYGAVVRIAGTVPLPTGAATAARQDTGNASLASIDGSVSSLAINAATELTLQNVLADVGSLPSIDVHTASIDTNTGTIAGNMASLLLAQGATLTSKLGPMVQGAVNSAAPALTDATVRPLSMTTAGALRVNDATASAQRDVMSEMLELMRLQTGILNSMRLTLESVCGTKIDPADAMGTQAN